MMEKARFSKHIRHFILLGFLLSSTIIVGQEPFYKRALTGAKQTFASTKEAIINRLNRKYKSVKEGSSAALKWATGKSLSEAEKQSLNAFSKAAAALAFDLAKIGIGVGVGIGILVYKKLKEREAAAGPPPPPAPQTSVLLGGQPPRQEPIPHVLIPTTSGEFDVPPPPPATPPLVTSPHGLPPRSTFLDEITTGVKLKKAPTEKFLQSPTTGFDPKQILGVKLRKTEGFSKKKPKTEPTPFEQAMAKRRQRIEDKQEKEDDNSNDDNSDWDD